MAPDFIGLKQASIRLSGNVFLYTYKENNKISYFRTSQIHNDEYHYCQWNDDINMQRNLAVNNEW